VNSKWLGLAGLTLGGNYGEATPTDLSFSISAPSKQVSFSTSARDCFGFGCNGLLHVECVVAALTESTVIVTGIIFALLTQFMESSMISYF